MDETSSLDPTSLWILSALTLVAVLTMLPGALAQLRDEIVNQGWVSRQGRLGRMTQRAQEGRAIAVLQRLGLTNEEQEEIRFARWRARRRANQLDDEASSRPDRALIRRVKPWVYRLDDPFSYRGSRYYLDMMGADQGRLNHEPSFAQIFEPWARALADKNVIRPFDFVVTPKDGNPLFASEVARTLGKPLIVCKGEADRARVGRPDETSPHETDFEGLRAFLNRQRERGLADSVRFRPLLIDDSCKSGSNLVSVANRLNALARDLQQYPFHMVEDVVVLFRVKGPTMNDEGFRRAGLRVHALIAVGPAELEKISTQERSQLIKEMPTFKVDDFACVHSKAFFHD